jgi:hypothetical protein
VNYVRNLLRYEPAVFAWAASGGLALLLAFVFHFTRTQEAAAATIVTALASAYTAWKAGPSQVPFILGLLATAITAAGAFGFHPSAHVLAMATSIASVLLPLVFRPNLTPKAVTTPAVHLAPQHAAPRVM